MKWTIDHSSSIPLHAQVESLLRQLVSEEAYRKGQPLPTESEVSQKLGISRNTFRAAMSKLVNEGIVIRKPGKGSRVNPKQVTTGLAAWSSFSHEMNAQGVKFETLSKRVLRVGAPKAAAEFFGVDVGADLILLERVRGEKEKPVVVFKSYLQPALRISEDETFDGPLYEILEERYNAVAAESNEEIRSFMPELDLRKQLKINKTTPVLSRERRVLDIAGRPLEYSECFYRADRFTYSITIKRDRD